MSDLIRGEGGGRDPGPSPRDLGRMSPGGGGPLSMPSGGIPLVASGRINPPGLCISCFLSISTILSI